MTMATCYQNYVQTPHLQIETYQPQAYMKPRVPAPDYSTPLHVDCSVEYELPDCAKPPQGIKIEPLLMIHPCHFRNLERQRRRPFENNLPVKTSQAPMPQPKHRPNLNYSCEYTNTLLEFPTPTNNTARYRNSVRSHPYALPCAPRCPDLPYAATLQHHPTLIYNV